MFHYLHFTLGDIIFSQRRGKDGMGLGLSIITASGERPPLTAYYLYDDVLWEYKDGQNDFEGEDDSFDYEVEFYSPITLSQAIEIAQVNPDFLTLAQERTDKPVNFYYEFQDLPSRTANLTDEQYLLQVLDYLQLTYKDSSAIADLITLVTSNLQDLDISRDEPITPEHWLLYAGYDYCDVLSSSLVRTRRPCPSEVYLYPQYSYVQYLNLSTEEVKLLEQELNLEVLTSGRYYIHLLQTKQLAEYEKHLTQLNAYLGTDKIKIAEIISAINEFH